MAKPTTVDEYIASCDTQYQPMLKQLRRLIKDLAPDAEEKLSYGMPYYGYHGRLAYFQLFKHHLGLYVPPPVIADHAKELAQYKTAMATVQLPLDKPLPVSIIKKLIHARIKINKANKK